jgi:hypothetical protein
LGIDPAPLLSRSGVSKADLSHHTRISVLSQIDFLGQISRATKDTWIGLTLAQDFDLREIGMLYYVAGSARTLGDALRRIERYARIGNEALTIQLDKAPTCRIRLSYTGVPRHLDRHQIECLTLAFLRLCRQVTGRKLTPLTASFAHHRSGNIDKMRRLFGCDVEFDAYADEMHFDPVVLDFPLVNADPFLSEIMVATSEEALTGRTSNTSPFRTLVENTVAPLLPHAEASQAGGQSTWNKSADLCSQACGRGAQFWRNPQPTPSGNGNSLSRRRRSSGVADCLAVGFPSAEFLQPCLPPVDG